MMNVGKVQRFSKEYEELKNFHDTCNQQFVQLSAKHTTYNETTLSSTTTTLIIVEGRKALLEAKSKLMKEIKAEVAK